MVAATDASDRIDKLDALRGFALLGIFTANILYWSGWIFRSTEQHVAFAGADGIRIYRRRVLVAGASRAGPMEVLWWRGTYAGLPRPAGA